MFDFFAEGAVQRAKQRAATLRGLVPQLAKAMTISLTNEGPHTTTGEASFVLRYAIPAMRLSRVVELSPTELAALRMLADRAAVRALPVSDADRLLVEVALSRLIGQGDERARAVRDSATPPPTS
jgi:hypothetical protein